jgi:hypothetical protein
MYSGSIRNALQWRTKMIRLSHIAVRLVLSLVVSSASPALGAARSNLPNYDARAQATMQDIGREDGVSPDRARSLRECNGRISGLAEHLWGAHRSAIYRACMAERGEVE